MGTVRFIQHMLKCSVMTDQLNATGESRSRFVSPQWARKLPADKSHLFCLVRPDMLEADYRLSAYKLKHTEMFFFFLLYYRFDCSFKIRSRCLFQLPFTRLKRRMNDNL